jgi:hypothetical protein
LARAKARAKRGRRGGTRVQTENLDNAAAVLRLQARRFILRADAAPPRLRPVQAFSD